MSVPISPISGGVTPDSIRPAGQPSTGGAFQDVFASAIQQVEAYGQSATESARRFLSGDGEELHTTILAAQRAEMAFDMFLQVRNKVVSAYQEIMRMQL
ncbi:MAG TPA: flagellar hook-basal body complex protein FliE [Bryobacteraceae bacterium]|nr:flagellar hook-basal body complex protein FliE [Bryobacteraceae bacterium]